MHIIAAKAVSFGEALEDNFKSYQEQVVKNAKALAEELKKNDFRLVSDGTDNHLILIDVRTKGHTGKDAETLLEDVGIATNKNTIPFDPESPFVTSGVRIGTPAMTTLGMKEDDMKEIAKIMTLALEKDRDVDKIKDMVSDLISKYPLY